MRTVRSSSESGKIGLLVALIIGAAVILGGISLYAYAASVRNTALGWETDLNKTVRIEVSERATYETSTLEQLGIGDINKDAIKDVVSAAMEGRYGDNPSDSKLLFKAVSEAYPDTQGVTRIYEKILAAVQAGREAIRNKQNLRIEKAQAYNYWRKEGLLRPMILSGIYPSNDLTFKVGDKTYKATEALEKMAEPISTASVNESFEKGIEKPLVIPKK